MEEQQCMGINGNSCAGRVYPHLCFLGFGRQAWPISSLVQEDIWCLSWRLWILKVSSVLKIAFSNLCENKRTVCWYFAKFKDIIIAISKIGIKSLGRSQSGGDQEEILSRKQFHLLMIIRCCNWSDPIEIITDGGQGHMGGCKRA